MSSKKTKRKTETETEATTKTTGRHSPAIRLNAVRALLNSGEGASVYDISDRLGVAVKTARRYLAALERAGEPLYDEWDGKRKVWRLMPTARKNNIRLSTSQMLSLFLSRRVFDFLEGTGFKEDLDDVFRQLEVTLKRQDAQIVHHLDRKIFDVNEAPRIYQDRVEDVGEILTALVREERLEVTHVSSVPDKRRSGQPRRFVIDPYTLMVYKKGLYLVGYSHRHEEIRTFAFDGFREVDWLRGQRFDYPDDYHPSQIVEGAFGLIGGEPREVRIRFSPRVARYIQRSRWHPSQKIRKLRGEGGAIELRMNVALTVELTSWILGFGGDAEVLAPTSLNAAIQREARAILEKYEMA
jgi:proteasome accessory factor B